MATNLMLHSTTARVLTPRETDRTCRASLPASVTRCIDDKWKNDRGADGQFESTFIGTEILPGVPKADLERSFTIVAASCAPADPQTVAAALHRLKLLTKSRELPGKDAELQAAAFFDQVSTYPADVVVDACEVWAAREVFFPSWAELKAELDRRMQRRLALKRALEKRIDEDERSAPPATDDERDRIAERQRVGAMMSELRRSMSAGQPKSDSETARERNRRVYQETRGVTLARSIRTKVRTADGRWVWITEGPSAEPVQAADEGEGWGS